MIALHDIQEAVAARLQEAGHRVTAAEIEEGFDKPSFFIDVFTASSEGQGQFYTVETVGVELRYIPEVETREHIVGMAEQIKSLFLSSALAVGERFLCVQEISFDADGPALLSYFELQFMQESPAKQPSFDKMAHLEERTGMNHGSTRNID